MKAEDLVEYISFYENIMNIMGMKWEGGQFEWYIKNVIMEAVKKVE